MFAKEKASLWSQKGGGRIYNWAYVLDMVREWTIRNQ